MIGCAGPTRGPWTQGIREADFLGKRIDYVLRVAQYEPESLLGMVSVAGPMPITYGFDRPTPVHPLRANGR